MTSSELADPEIVDDDVFRLLINAKLIARFGVSAFNLQKEESENDR